MLSLVRGKNIYPHFVEDAVMDCHPALQPHACAAISLDHGDGEKLMIIQEIKRTFFYAILTRVKSLLPFAKPWPKSKKSRCPKLF